MSEKSFRRNVSADTVLLFKIVSQNAADCISAHIHFKTFRGDMPPDPLGSSWPLPTWDFSPKR